MTSTTTIRIQERGVRHDGPVVVIDGLEYPVTLRNPFSDADEARLEWYFEEWLSFPFTRGELAREAAASVRAYGEALFEQLFADRKAYAAYDRARQKGVDSLLFEIAGSPDFHGWFWEALKDPEIDAPLSVHAPFVRRNVTPRTLESVLAESPTLNVLVVTARPSEVRDVGYRTISRPLVESLRRSRLPVQVDILRPATYESLLNHLKGRPSGYYHVIHFDTHGSLMSYASVLRGSELGRVFFSDRYGRDDIQQYPGERAYLFLESDTTGKADQVEAGELAALLQTHQIPIVILNACQSAKAAAVRSDGDPEGAEKGQEAGDEARHLEQETTLAGRLMEAGAQMVLAMRYSVTVSAAERLMDHLYRELFAGRELGEAIRHARRELYNVKSRRAAYRQQIDLEDWLLPVVYENQPQQLRTRAFTEAEHAEFFGRRAARYREPDLTYAFLGRDLDILRLEKMLLTRGNILLLRGMGGAGKTALLHHVAAWWQSTHFVEQVFYFGWDARAWNRQQIMDEMARRLMGEVDYLRYFQPASPDVQQETLAALLRATRHLLILDNLESIRGTHLAIKNTLAEGEQQALRAFLRELAGGESLLLLGSRGGEGWLAAGTFGDNV
ncbi:MAG: CHAT domain-containing protein, partial [Caldilineaceae bacterium]|nr:CHAT domain-containing protein [Caldilineaceae bacterium]